MDFSFLDDWAKDEGAPIEEHGEGYRNIWVVAETSGDRLLAASLEATGQARELADRIGVYVYCVLLGSAAEPQAQSLIAHGADSVLVADDPDLDEYQPERFVTALANLVQRYRPEILLAAATPLVDDMAPRLAQELGTGLISHCVKLDIDMSERSLLGTFEVYNGEMFHTASIPTARPQIATLQPGSYSLPYEDSGRYGNVQIVNVDLDSVPKTLTWDDLDTVMELPAPPLANSRIVVSAGRGMGDADGYALVEQLAQALGGAPAGSRGAFDEGWIPERAIIGIGGASIRPDLYIACGLSGDIYHYFGVQDARFVVAINHDPDAPIVKMANMAAEGDARQIVSAMLLALNG